VWPLRAWTSFRTYSARTPRPRTVRCTRLDTYSGPILDNLENASGAEAFEGLGLLVLLAILGKVKSISEEVLNRAGQGTQVPLRASHPVERLQGRRFVHLHSLYLH